MEELPSDHSPESYAHINFGATEKGIQAWCVRHNCNIVHIDFEGHKHPANESCPRDPTEPHLMLVKGGKEK